MDIFADLQGLLDLSCECWRCPASSAASPPARVTPAQHMAEQVSVKPYGLL